MSSYKKFMDECIVLLQNTGQIVHFLIIFTHFQETIFAIIPTCKPKSWGFSVGSNMSGLQKPAVDAPLFRKSSKAKESSLTLASIESKTKIHEQAVLKHSKLWYDLNATRQTILVLSQQSSRSNFNSNSSNESFGVSKTTFFNLPVDLLAQKLPFFSNCS